MSGIRKAPGLNGYVFADKIGSGSFADVYKAFRKGECREIFAIKCVEKDKLSKTAFDNLISEIEILKKVQHSNIVKLFDFIWDDVYIYLIMEYCSGGSLSEFIKKQKCLPENVCQHFLQQVVLALKYLRENGISHFDLKPQNILLTSVKMPNLKLGDFGLAQSIAECDTITDIKGTLLYMAPEIILQKQYDARADIWSVGIILYECLFGKAPYTSKTHTELINKIKLNQPIEIPFSANISPECRDFLTRCLEREICKRFDFEQFFKHSFVDLEHAPLPSSMSKACECFSQAIQYDKESKTKEAFDCYQEAVRYLVPLLYIEKDAAKRVHLRKKILGYTHKINFLKKKLENGDDKPSTIPPTIPSYLANDPFYSYLEYKGNLSELLRLARSTPNMAAAIEIAENAILYEKEGKYDTALNNYELALGKLLNLLSGEPPGRRRDLLLEEINRWMGQAEQVKVLTGNADSGLAEAEMSKGEIEKTCSIQ